MSERASGAGGSIASRAARRSPCDQEVGSIVTAGVSEKHLIDRRPARLLFRFDGARKEDVVLDVDVTVQIAFERGQL